jgi:tetratricopeptide (TPR) repeat protein
VEEPLSINIFTTEAGANKSTTGVNGQFVFSQVLIDCLLRLKSTERDTNELIDCCTSQYEGNQSELNNLREFQEYYSPDKALWWYTRESFFYKTLNAALRTQNIHMIFLFRAFIADIYRQLQSNRANNPLRVYRSQLMSSDELDSLKQHISQFISVNSFFSTSNDRTTALFLLGDSSVLIDLERVLFEIDADPKIITSKSFADIRNLSHFPVESEILFMLGSIFRLERISHNDDDKVWIIQMTLCGDDEHELKQVLMYMKQQIGNGETNFRTLGKILSDMGKFDLAEKYFTRLLKQIQSDDPLLSDLYEELGKVASQTGDYDMSMQWHQKSLAFKQQNQLTTNLENNETNSSLSKC